MIWSNTLLWSGGAAPRGYRWKPSSTNTDTATFNTALTSGTIGGTTDPVLINSGRAIQNITFNGSAGAYFIGTTGGNALYLTNGGAITFSAGNQTINAPLTLTGASYLFNETVYNTTATIGGAINNSLASGTAFLTIQSTSGATISLTGIISDGANAKTALIFTSTVAPANNTYNILTSANTFTGGVEVKNFGIIDIQNAAALGTGTLQLDNGSYIQNTSGNHHH